jgi:diadenosine tetraphosphate (Ap4A) HIT family hydrolase
MSSVFTEIPESSWIMSNDNGFAIFDNYPVNKGHALIISKREVASWWDLSSQEQSSLLELVSSVKDKLDETFRPDGWNVGINIGSAAGQTVFHLHIHLIPRYRGDMEDPRGGVRHVIPERGNYRLPSFKNH